MIVGIGVDIVGIERFEQQLARTPRLIERLFAEGERALALPSLAARFAAKEAFVKALGRDEDLSYVDIEVEGDEHGKPGFVFRGRAAEVLRARGIGSVHLSITHDAGVACAFVVAEADGAAASSVGVTNA